MNATVILDYAQDEKVRISLPKPKWEGKETIDTGLTCLAVYVRKDGRVILKTDSIWENRKTHACVGVTYTMYDMADLNHRYKRPTLERIGL